MSPGESEAGSDFGNKVVALDQKKQIEQNAYLCATHLQIPVKKHILVLR